MGPEHLSRRRVAAGMAWAVPVVTIAAAAPAHAASPVNPGCGCLRVGFLGTFTTQAVTVASLGSVTGTVVFNLDSRQCDTGFFQPAYTILGGVGGGSLAFSDNTSYPFTIGTTTGVGTVGQISAFTTPPSP